MNILFFLLCLAGGFALIRYSQWIVNATSIRFQSVENFMPGGTYSVVKVIGVGLIAFGFWYLVK